MKPLLLAFALLAACSASEVGPAAPPAVASATPTATAPAAPAEAAPAAPAEAPTPECLSKADLADGTADQKVTKCANCALHMDGDPEYVSTHAGHTFHSCSPGCKTALDKDPGKVLARACK